jgi:hypothetical protein
LANRICENKKRIRAGNHGRGKGEGISNTEIIERHVLEVQSREVNTFLTL